MIKLAYDIPIEWGIEKNINENEEQEEKHPFKETWIGRVSVVVTVYTIEGWDADGEALCK